MQDPVIQWVAHKFYERPLQPNELQVARKILYGVLVLVLFVGAFFWRTQVVEAEARRLALREESRGDVELSGSLVRLTLTGSRGLATCVLWMAAIESQKKNQWNELEFYVNALTRLQPYFTRPWLFQSWNLSYNVAAESDRWADKYFFITRGVQLLYRGERQNRNNPDMRSYIGFYTQHKICQSDETHVHRSLFQLSCIPLNERDPARFRTVDASGKETFNWKEFDDFCRKHPQLVRRLRTGIRREGQHSERVSQRLADSQFRCTTVQEVVNFLADNWRLPSLYQDAQETLPGQNWDPHRQDLPRPLTDRFPVLPPPRTPPAPQRLFERYPGATELTTGPRDADRFLSQLDDNVDGWDVARAWYGYAQEPIPDPDPVQPGENQKCTDLVLQRVPKYMMTVLFRSQPALAQTHHADRLMEEGWFDAEPWPIETWYDNHSKRFEPVEGETVGSFARLAVPQGNALEAWKDAYLTWEWYGTVNHLKFRDAADEQNTLNAARAYCERHRLPFKSRPPEPPGGSESLSREELAGFQAAGVVARQESTLRTSNFAHHLHRAEIERLPETMQARRLFYYARTQTLASNFDAALAAYRSEHAIKAWIDKVLIPHPLFRKDEFIQEQSVDVSLGYLSVYNQFAGPDAFAWALRLQVLYPATAPGDGLAQAVNLASALNVNKPDPSKPKNRITIKANAHILTQTPFDVGVPDETQMLALAAVGVGLGEQGPLAVGPAIVSSRSEPLLNPAIVHRVMIDKELIPRDPKPATAPTPAKNQRVMPAAGVR